MGQSKEKVLFFLFRTEKLVNSVKSHSLAILRAIIIATSSAVFQVNLGYLAAPFSTSSGIKSLKISDTGFMDQMLSVLYPTNSVKALNELQDTVIRIDRNQEKSSLAHPFFTLHWRL